MQTPILRNARARAAAPGRLGVFESRTLDITWPVAEGPGRARGRRRARLRRGRRGARRRRQHPDPLRPRASGPSARRSRRCSRSPPCTTTSCARARACRPGLVVESGEPREVHHFATLIGYGASAVNPYLMFESLAELVERRPRAGRRRRRRRPRRNVVKGIGKGLLKTISKMGISTIQSYSGAQIFEAVGLGPGWSTAHFTGTASRIGGIGLDVLAQRDARPPRARLPAQADDDLLPVGGVYAWRRDGEHHMWNPETIALLQHAVRHGGAPDLRGVRAARQRGRRARAPRCAGCCASGSCPRTSGCRSTRSSPRRRSSSASPPARCRSARSRARRTRRSRSR